MSREDIELVTRALEAAAKRPMDFDTINALYHPDHVFVPVTSKIGDHSEAIGARGFKAWSEGQASVMSWDMEFEGAIDLPPGTVLAVGAFRWHGAASDIDIEQRMWMVLTVVDGKITRTEAYFDPAEALEAAGLGE